MQSPKILHIFSIELSPKDKVVAYCLFQIIHIAARMFPLGARSQRVVSCQRGLLADLCL